MAKKYLVKSTLTAKASNQIYAEGTVYVYLEGKTWKCEEEQYCNKWFVENFGYSTRKMAERQLKHIAETLTSDNEHWNVKREVVELEY